MDDECIFPDCTNARNSRGLCSNHYRTATRMLASGQADEADLIKRGMILPKYLKARLKAACAYAAGVKKRCLFLDCPEPGAVRGLCKSHYSTARSMINGGQATESGLISKGFLLMKESQARYYVFSGELGVAPERSAK